MRGRPSPQSRTVSADEESEKLSSDRGPSLSSSLVSALEEAAHAGESSGDRASNNSAMPEMPLSDELGDVGEELVLSDVLLGC
eukprot:3177567-Pyramimonas_sp.AAC.1